MNPAAPLTPPRTPPRWLEGDLLIWLIALLELGTFALIFLGYAVSRTLHPKAFAAGQAQLSADAAAVYTAVLLVGSWAVVRGLQALRRADDRAALRWWLAATACGFVFLLLKGREYARHFAAGLSLDGSPFETYYLLLTGFHYLHVTAATVVLGLVGIGIARGRFTPDELHTPETAGIFWHLVDLLWIVLFPLVYVLR